MAAEAMGTIRLRRLMAAEAMELRRHRPMEMEVAGLLQPRHLTVAEAMEILQPNERNNKQLTIQIPTKEAVQPKHGYHASISSFPLSLSSLTLPESFGEDEDRTFSSPFFSPSMREFHTVAWIVPQKLRPRGSVIGEGVIAVLEWGRDMKEAPFASGSGMGEETSNMLWIQWSETDGRREKNDILQAKTLISSNPCFQSVDLHL